MKKIFITLFIIGLVLSGAGLVYGAYLNYSKQVHFVASSSKSIVSDSTDLNSVILVFNSKPDIKSAHIHSICNTKSRFITSDNDLYFFKFSLLDNKCANPYFSLKKWEEIYVNTRFSLNIQQDSDLFSIIIDYSTKQILKAHRSINKKIEKYSSYKKLKETQWTNFVSLLRKQRIYNELVYKQDMLTNILTKRKQKYSLPVKWYKIATWLNVIPNADRHYRKAYTDGVHHGWDIMAPAWTPVSAIDEWIIIRVVSDFEYADISNIKKGEWLTHSDKLRNLDILRGNQVWLKTTKWDVIFYSHLTEIYDNIVEWAIISEWTDIGTIGKSWVPDKNYTNYHLHFPIQKNPYTPKKAWKYSLEDIMDWDWYLKWLDATWVVNGQIDIFKTEEAH